MPTRDTPIRVLVADDNRDAADSLAMILDLLGFEVRTTTDGETAWGAALTFRPDACVLDIHMPAADGCEVARRLRAAFGNRVLLVAVTGVTGSPYDERIDAAGFDRRLAKPTDPQLLTRLLSRARSCAPVGSPEWSQDGSDR